MNASAGWLRASAELVPIGPWLLEQGRAAGSHTGRAIVALGREPDVFAVGQPARGDGVIGVDVAQSAGAPMG